MLESTYQARLIKRIKRLFPGCVILKNDTDYIQGFPDLTILYGYRWACLEVKLEMNSSRQPNQDYYVEMLNAMSFAAFICPENEMEVLHGLQQAFEPEWNSRIS